MKKRIAALLLSALLLSTASLFVACKEDKPQTDITPSVRTTTLEEISASYIFLLKGGENTGLNTSSQSLIENILRAYNGAEISAAPAGTVMDAATVITVTFITEDGQVVFSVDEKGTCRLNNGETLYVMTDTFTLHRTLLTVYSTLEDAAMEG